MTLNDFLPKKETRGLPSDGSHISFNPKLLAAVARCAGPKDIRPFFRGVRFEGKIAVASDGVVLTVARDCDADNTMPDGVASISIPGTVATKMKNAPRYASSAVFDLEENLVLVNGERLDMGTSPLQEGVFPDWRSLCPSGEPVSASFQAWSLDVHRLIVDVTRILDQTAVRISCYGENAKMAVVRYGHRDDVFTLAMTRTNYYIGSGNPLPSWATGETA